MTTTSTFSTSSQAKHWFWERYWSILRMALTSGTSKLNVDDASFPPKHNTLKDKRKFYAACHRGYDKAQRCILETIIELRDDDGISEEQRNYFEILLRRVVDSIAFTIFSGEIHIVRRFSINDQISNLNMEDLIRVQSVVDKYNAESRQSFSLLADLSTFIQVGDIIRIDLREEQTKLNIIEVKSGKVNYLLNEFLDRFEARPEVLEAIKECKVLDSRYKKQAQRMMKQKIRMSQLHEVITTDTGIDIQTGQRIVFPEKRIETGCYGAELSELCDVAVAEGYGGVCIDETIHAVAFKTELLDNDPTLLRKLLVGSIIQSRCSRPEIKEIEDRLLSDYDASEVVRIVNPVKNNLLAMACTPCLVWPLAAQHLRSLLYGELQLVFAFDTPGFIRLVEGAGGEVSFSTKRESNEIKKKFGRAAGFSWGRKYMVINGLTQLGGSFSRIINDLTSPSSIVTGMMNTTLEFKEKESA